MKYEQIQISELSSERPYIEATFHFLTGDVHVFLSPIDEDQKEKSLNDQALDLLESMHQITEKYVELVKGYAHLTNEQATKIDEMECHISDLNNQ